MTAGVVHVWPKNSREEIRASLETFRGYRMAHVRVYVDDKPTPKGIAVRVDQIALLKESVDALVAAVELEARAA